MSCHGHDTPATAQQMEPSSRSQQGVAMRMCTILLAAVLLAAGAMADSNAEFVYPPDGSALVFNMMDTVMVTYTTNYEDVILYTFCQPGVGKMS